MPNKAQACYWGMGNIHTDIGRRYHLITQETALHADWANLSALGASTANHNVYKATTQSQDNDGTHPSYTYIFYHPGGLKNYSNENAFKPRTLYEGAPNQGARPDQGPARARRVRETSTRLLCSNRVSSRMVSCTTAKR